LGPLSERHRSIPGSPTLVFVHGFGCTLEDWSAQFDGLSSSFKCVALDLPGHGSSAKPEQPSIAALALAVNAVKAESGGAEVILIGHSMGAKVIREAYRQSSQGVRGLVFVDSSIYVGDQDTLIKKQRDAIAKAGFYPYVEGLFGQMFVQGSDEGLKQRLVARSRNINAALGEELLVDSIRWELSKGAEALKDIAVPCLVIQSTYYNSDFKRVALEPGVSTPFMDTVKATVPNSEVKGVLGVGHFPMIEAAGTVNTYIADFARKVRT
jgi:pimeloyl-ACP methyl ester carboxylesterase